MESKINQAIIDAVHDVCEDCICRKNCNQRCYEVVKMVSLSADIERIARQEERERCIRIAIDAHCKFCSWYFECKSNNFDNVKMDVDCDEREQIRKAMEGGNNGND